MNGVKEWFTLREVAGLWRPVDAGGEVLTGSAAIDEVLKMIFVSVAGLRLQASYNLSTPIQAERFTWSEKGSWERFELEGMVNIRFRRGHIRSDDGFIWIHADDGCDGVPNELFVLPDDPKLKIRVACQHNMVAEDECFSDSVVKLDEAGLLVSREALAEYACKRGRNDVLERLDKQKTVLVVPAVEEVEQVDDSQNKGGRPPEYLTEVLEYAYLDCRKRGDTSILEPHQLGAFLKHLQKLVGGSRDKTIVSEYVSQRIEVVQPSNVTECVKTHDRTIEGKPFKKGEWYSQADISTRMNTLRKKYRLPTKENIQQPVVSESGNRGLKK